VSLTGNAFSFPGSFRALVARICRTQQKRRVRGASGSPQKEWVIGNSRRATRVNAITHLISPARNFCSTGHFGSFDACSIFLPYLEDGFSLSFFQTFTERDSNWSFADHDLHSRAHSPNSMDIERDRPPAVRCEAAAPPHAACANHASLIPLLVARNSWTHCASRRESSPC
jgi:hypothetical protein